MRQFFRVLALSICLTLALTLPCLADGGLDGFAELRSMETDTFSDVSPSHWFYSGVKCAYDLGIMEGMGQSTFDPGRTVPWSQAVTIASRVRAAYVGEDIPATEGAWYMPYVAYAEHCGILPEQHPEGVAWNTTAIDRQSIAYLFQAVVGAEDCPAISDQIIPDLDNVEEDKRAAVQALYAAGIITGKTGGNFDPKGLATRSELATILTRLLRPAYRVASDSRFNSDMLGQEGNFVLDSGLYYDGEATYLIYRSGQRTDEGSYQAILRRDEVTGKVSEIYTTSGEQWTDMQKLLCCDDWLYFIERSNNYVRTLTRLNLETGKTEALCSSPHEKKIDTFEIYDGRIFAVQSNFNGNFNAILGEVVNGSFRPIGKYERIGALHGYNGKLFFMEEATNTLMSYDLATKKIEKLIENICASVICGDKIYYSLWVDRAYNGQIWMASLCDPGRPVTYGTIPDSALGHYAAINHDGEDLYYITSSKRVLYRVNPGEVATPVLTNRWATVECPIIWGNTYMAGNIGFSVGNNNSGEYPIVTDFSTGKAFTSNVDAWLGYSALMTRTVYPQDGDAYVDGSAYTEDAEMNAILRKAYYSDGRLVLDIDYRNSGATDLRVKSMTLTAKAGDVTLAEELSLSYSETLSPGKTGCFTALVQGDDLLAQNVDLSDLRWQCTVAYISLSS